MGVGGGGGGAGRGGEGRESGSMPALGCCSAVVEDSNRIGLLHH